LTQEGQPEVRDFSWVKARVTSSLGDDDARTLWVGLLKLLEDDGENALKKKLEEDFEAFLAEGISLYSGLESATPTGD